MNNWSFTDYSIGISIFLVLLLIGLGIPIILLGEYFIRPKKMKGLAREFSLSYDKNDGFVSNSGKRNIVAGNIGTYNVEIYDYGATNEGAIETYLTQYGAAIRSKRFTVFALDGKKETLVGKISGYYPISKIRQKLLALTAS